jgi:potassium-transporting ATPase ATP-binding subunit
MNATSNARTIFSDRETVIAALKQSVAMLNPIRMMRNPVMFVTEIGAAISTAYTVMELSTGGRRFGYFLALTLLLWVTVLFANFAEALAEARGKAQANSLRKRRISTMAHKLVGEMIEDVTSDEIEAGDVVIVRAGEVIPNDGEVIEGAASVDESAITGESAPVIREAGGDRSGVTGGTTVLSDEITIRVTSSKGESFLDRMIALVEGAIRQKTPNELALTVVLAGLTLVFLLVVAALLPSGLYFGVELDVPTLVALLVCLIPTTIGALLAAIGLAGMDRALRANVLAKSGKAVELAGDIDTLLLDKTGTITVGDRQATEFRPVAGVLPIELYKAALLASLGDRTPEGRSIVALSRGYLGSDVPARAADVRVIEFSAKTRISGMDDADGHRYRKGAVDAIRSFMEERGAGMPEEALRHVEAIAKEGKTPVVVARDAQVLGVVGLSDILKKGIREKVLGLKKMGLRVIMITGDNPLTAASIAASAGVDDFIAEATPEMKLAYIREEQAQGRLVAMMGDGTNDAPALAQADIGLAMNSGTQAAKEASNMVDLDSDPTKLIRIIEIGKQLLITRGALTTFSIANDVAKYFAIIPAMFMLALPHLAALNIMRLATPYSAILSAVIFNAIIIPLLIPIAIRGVKYRPVGADKLLFMNTLVYGVGGLAAPFIGIKLIDLCLAALGLA